MVGGTASGKSTIAGPAADLGLIVFESTFSSYELSKRRLHEALGAGRTVEVSYIFRDPVDAWNAAMRRTEEEGLDVFVTPEAHAQTHRGAAETVARLAAEFADEAHLGFSYYANSSAAGLLPGGIEFTARLATAELERLKALRIGRIRHPDRICGGRAVPVE